jgi:hypothetical protein
MPVTIETVDDFIEKNGGDAVVALDYDGSWMGLPAGTPLLNGTMKLLPTGAWVRYADNGEISWQVPGPQDRRKWQIAYLHCKKIQLNEEGRRMQEFIWNRFEASKQEPSQEELKSFYRVRDTFDAVKKKLAEMDPPDTYAPPPMKSPEELAREDRDREARDRIAAAIGAPPAPEEVTRVRMSLNQAMGLRANGINVHVGQEAGQPYGEVRYDENPGLKEVLEAVAKVTEKNQNEGPTSIRIPGNKPAFKKPKE